MFNFEDNSGGRVRRVLDGAECDGCHRLFAAAAERADLRRRVLSARQGTPRRQQPRQQQQQHVLSQRAQAAAGERRAHEQHLRHWR